MYPSVILSTWTFLQVVLYSATSHAQFVPPSHFYNTTSAFISPRKNVISQQDLSLAPPIPILDIGLQHMLGQMGANATRAENVSNAEADGRPPPPEVSKFTLLYQKNAPAECGPGQPCADQSCCNSEGKCGFKPYNCVSSAATTCISNCDAHAMCGVDSLQGQQKCDLNLCCSYFGYCGATDAHCATQGQTPCQPGFGDCQVMSAPNCTTKTASKGRRVAYYQGGGANRVCDLVYPSQIDTTGLTHLNFAFASIDPVTFSVTAADPKDFLLYHQFTSLSSPHRLQTWISIGGGGFSGPGPTHTTWSDLSSSPSNRAAFIFSLVGFMHKWGFQGVDLDWETPAQPGSGGKPEDTANLALLIMEMRTAFGTKYGISLALPNDFNYLAAFNPIALQPYAALSDIERTLLPIWFDGLDASKLNLGLPYYGRGATVSSTSCVDLNCPYSSLSRPGQCSGEAGILSLKEIQDIITQRHLIPKVLPGIFQKSITFDDQWISYDDSDTVAQKTQWADQHCFGGTMIWSVDLANGNGRFQHASDHPSVIAAQAIHFVGQQKTTVQQGKAVKINLVYVTRTVARLAFQAFQTRPPLPRLCIISVARPQNIVGKAANQASEAAPEMSNLPVLPAVRQSVHLLLFLSAKTHLVVLVKLAKAPDLGIVAQKMVGVGPPPTTAH
ncbi:Chitotriosidase [Lachnellula subtilissima]|uniref:chitinase n=1 Tax=Lachnellula subtilissima TaxID=602034 RepID=A0A8H8U5K5_9HELO|nr:Chitotriosidase [Lachnellula subtilissima]